PRQAQPAARDDDAQPPRATIALTTMKIAAAIENTNPIGPGVNPSAASSSGASRFTTPSTNPTTSIIKTAPVIMRLRVITPTVRRSDTVSIACGIPAGTKHNHRATTNASTEELRNAVSIEKRSATYPTSTGPARLPMPATATVNPT